MTEPAVAPAADPSAADPSAAALQRYAVSVGRQRRRYAAVIAVVVVLLGVFVAVAWSRGELANTTLRTASSAAPDLPASVPTASLRVAWRTPDLAALGTPQWLGTVVVRSKHTVRGLDARTGAERWSYTRSNRTTCAAVQTSGTTFALFRVNGNCDQLTALDSSTGARRWTRTLDEDGKPLNGTPDISLLAFTVMFSTPSVIYAIDPGSGYDRWTYAVPGCTIQRAVLGTAGALISQTCTTPRCGGVTFCTKGPQLFLRDGSQGRDDKSQTNPDHVIWSTKGSTSIAVSADGVVSALDPASGRLSILRSTNGDVIGGVTVPARRGAPDTVAIAADSAEIIYLGGVAYAVTASRPTPLWSVLAQGPPTVVSATAQDVPELTSARITVPTSRGIAELDGASGQDLRLSEVTPPGAGSSVRPMGTGYLVSGASGTIAYA